MKPALRCNSVWLPVPCISLPRHQCGGCRPPRCKAYPAPPTVLLGRVQYSVNHYGMRTEHSACRHCYPSTCPSRQLSQLSRQKHEVGAASTASGAFTTLVQAGLHTLNRIIISIRDLVIQARRYVHHDREDSCCDAGNGARSANATILRLKG